MKIVFQLKKKKKTLTTLPLIKFAAAFKYLVLPPASGMKKWRRRQR